MINQRYSNRDSRFISKLTKRPLYTMTFFHLSTILTPSSLPGVVAWAVSAEVVMGVQREAALKNQVRDPFEFG